MRGRDAVTPLARLGAHVTHVIDRPRHGLLPQSMPGMARDVQRLYTSPGANSEDYFTADCSTIVALKNGGRSW